MRPGISTTDSHVAPFGPFQEPRLENQLEACDGAEGGDLDGRPVVILATRGATSGAVRRTPIMRVVDGEAYVAIASYAGNPENPAWYRKLAAHPGRRDPRPRPAHSVRAREVHGDEKTRPWAIADTDNPAYARYRATAGPDISLLLLEPEDTENPPT